MGISIEEFLQDQQPCEVCDSTGNQQHCVTELLSRVDCCIFYNVVHLNLAAHTDVIAMLQSLRASGDRQMVLDYYVRSKKIVEIINQQSDPSKSWTDIWDQYVSSIFHKVKNGQDVIVDVFEMLEDLESQLGLV
jgi:hypothetical protein